MGSEHGRHYRLAVSVWILLTVASLHISSTYGQIYDQRETACGNKAELLNLYCPKIGNKVTVIRVTTITTTFKTDCPTSPGAADCYNIVPSTNSFYQKVIDECQSKKECFVTAQQIPIPLCASVIHNGNYVEVTYDCVPNGQTVPTTTQTTTTTTRPTSSTNVPTTPSVTGGQGTLSTTASNNGTVNAGGQTDDDDSDNSGTIAAVVITVVILVLLIILIALVTVFYRRRKLPYKMQVRLSDGIQTVGDKLGPVVTGISGAAGRLKERVTNRDSSDKPDKNGPPVQVEDEEIYSSIDELNGAKYSSYQAYQDWDKGNTNVAYEGEKEKSHLPTILVVPNSGTGPTRSNITSIPPNDTSDQSDTDDEGWGDSEFDDDSADDNPANQSTNQSQSSVTVRPRSMRKKSGRKQSGFKPPVATKPDKKISVTSIAANNPNDHPEPGNRPYQGLKLAGSGTLTSVASSHHYAETGLALTPDRDEDYYSVAPPEDDDYYAAASSTCDAYDEAQPVANATNC